MGWKIDGELIIEEHNGNVVGSIVERFNVAKVEILWTGGDLTYEGTRREAEAFIKGAEEMLARLNINPDKYRRGIRQMFW